MSAVENTELDVDLSTLTNKALVELYNRWAWNLGVKVIKKFENRETAEKRTTEIMAKAKNAGTAPLGVKKAKGPKAAPEAPVPQDVVEDQPVATPATEDPTPEEPEAPAKPKKAPPDRPKGPQNGRVLRSGSNREKLWAALKENLNQSVPLETFHKAVYGASTKEEAGKFQMVLKGIAYVMDRDNAPYKLVKERKDGVSYLGLFDK